MAMQESRAITRNSASNLALAFIMLPKARRDAMAALYAFCRAVDDVADEDTHPVDQRRSELSAWRSDLQTAFAGGTPAQIVNRELQPTIHQFKLPFELFDELINGCEMDLDTTRYETWADLELYCYRVASVVGLLSLEIFGYQNPRCRDYAVALGHALQLTNILRDVSDDAARGRIYLPLAELRNCCVAEEEVLSGQFSGRYATLAESVAARTQQHYQAARDILPPEDRRAMVAAELMGSVYWRLFRKLRDLQFNVWNGGPVRLSRPLKLALILRAWIRHLAHRPRSDYGKL